MKSRRRAVNINIDSATLTEMTVQPLSRPEMRSEATGCIQHMPTANAVPPMA